MTDAFDEVEEKLREDKLSRLWRVSAPWLYAVATLVIIGVGTREFLQWRAEGAARKSAERFEAARDALEAANFDDLTKALDADTPLTGGYGVLMAQLGADAALAQGGGPTEAARILTEAADASESVVLADLSRVKAAYHLAEFGSIDEIRAVLQPVIDRGGRTSLLARELIAFKLNETGDRAAARAEWDFLKLNPNAPQGVQQRAELALAAYPALPAAAPASVPEAAPTAPQN